MSLIPNNRQKIYVKQMRNYLRIVSHASAFTPIMPYLLGSL